MDREQITQSIMRNSIGRIVGTRIHPQDIQQIFFDLLEYIDQELELVANKMERVELEFDDQAKKIYMKNDATKTALSYAQVLDLVNDPTKFVTLFYALWYLLPQYNDEGGAIVFTGLAVNSEVSTSIRVAITDGDIKHYLINLENMNYKTADMTKETIDGRPTYPTTKAVKDYIDSKLG